MTELSASVQAPETATPVADPLQQQRIAVYRLLAALLRDVPPPELLAELAALESGAQPPPGEGDEWQLLGLAARSSRHDQVDDEYHELFIGLGRGELVPYGSWYLTGYLMEQPLSRLRDDLARLGFERDADSHEPEDHVAALLEVMSMLIESGESRATQADFFNAHLAPWMPRFFEDLEQARHAVFFRAVARIGRQFLELESREYPG